jgi:hypothetical protein
LKFTQNQQLHAARQPAPVKLRVICQKTYEISIGKIVLGGDLCRFIFVLFGEGRIVVIDDGDY